MNFVVHIILPYLLLYKYVGIFLITFFAALALPIPPGTLLMASAAFAGQGYFSFFWVVFWGSAGNIAGDNLGYWLARVYGKRVLYGIGFRKIIDSEKYKRIEESVKRRSGVFIFFSRFEVFSNLAVNIIAGLGKIPYPKYLSYEIIGEVLQVLIYCSIGYIVGDNWQAISTIISHFLLLIILIAALVVALFWKKIFRRTSTK